MKNQNIQDSFSEEQKVAINCKTKNILLTARAGSGKTKVLTERAKRLLNDGLSKDEILIFAFNNKAVNEINERLNLEIAKTFHSFSNSFANIQVSNNDFFDQMVIEATSKIRKKDIEKIKHILIDEFQDFTRLFFDLIQKILKLNSKINIFAVGDDWQHIYSFAGAEIEFFENFDRYFTPSKKLFLTTNFRSKKAIVENGNQIMGNNSVKSVSKGGVVENIADFNQIKKIISSKVENSTIAIISMKNRELFEIRQAIGIDNKNLFFVTAHSSKGLQFDIVILLEDTFYYRGRVNREVFYVASTRAKNELYLFDGDIPYSYKSIEIEDLDIDLMSNIIFFILRLSPNREIVNIIQEDYKKLQSFVSTIFQSISLSQIQKIVSTFNRYNFENLSIEEIKKLEKIRVEIEISTFDRYDFLEAKDEWHLALLSYDRNIKYAKIGEKKMVENRENIFIWNGKSKTNRLDDNFEKHTKKYISKQKQDEFETKQEFKDRVFAEAINTFLGKQNISMRYDADEKRFSEKLKYGLNFAVSVPRDIAREFKDEVTKFDISVDKDLKIINISVDFFGETYVGKGFDSLLIFNLVERKSLLVEIDNLMFQNSNLPKEMNWKSACEYCEKLKLAGFSDWKLPNIYELQIVYKNKDKFKNIENSEYWSVTEWSSFKSEAVNFFDGIVFYVNKTNNCYVRCVR